MWDELTMDQKARWMAFFARNGVYNRDIMKDRYDSMYLSKMEKVAQDNYRNWGYQDQDQALVHALNDNTYDYNKWFADNPGSMENSDTHWTDRYKTVYHPTFSDESMYSGVVDRNYNPEGSVGGSWDGDEFVQPDLQYGVGGSIHINPKNRGKFNATKKRTGKTTEELTHSKNPVTRKRAIFAQNARKWNHKHQEGNVVYSEDVDKPMQPPKPVFQNGNMYLANDKYVFLPEFDIVPQDEAVVDEAPYLNRVDVAKKDDNIPQYMPNQTGMFADSPLVLGSQRSLDTYMPITPIGQLVDDIKNDSIVIDSETTNVRKPDVYIEGPEPDTGIVESDRFYIGKDGQISDRYSGYKMLQDDIHNRLVNNAEKIYEKQFAENATDYFNTLKESGSHEDIMQLQKQMLDAGYYDNVFDKKVNDLKKSGVKNIKDIQRILVEDGYYERNSKSEIDGIVGDRTINAYKSWLNDNVADGVIGDDTEKAFNEYLKNPNQGNSEKQKFQYMDTGAEPHKCAKFVTDAMADAGIDTDASGIYGNAWTMFGNIKSHDGNVFYNIYDSSFNNVKDKKTLVSKTEEAIKEHPIDYESLKTGDVVGIYIRTSPSIPDALKEGTTKNTHVGIIEGYDSDGMPMVRHNINGHALLQRADRLSGSLDGSKSVITVAARVGDETIPKLNWKTDRQSEYQYNYENPDEVSENRKQYVQEYMDSVASSKDQIHKLYPGVDVDSLEKAAIGILKREGNFMEVMEPSIKEQITQFGRDLLKNESDRTVRSSGIKMSSLTNTERRILGVTKRDDLKNSIPKQAQAVMLKMAKNYDYFDRYAKKHPELGITDDEKLNLTILAYNQGMGKLYELNPSTLEILRNTAFNEEYRYDLPYKDSYMGQIFGDMDFAKKIYENRLQRTYEPYVVAARHAMENIVPKNNNTNADGGYLNGIIWDNNGQWAHPGQITGITGTKNGTDITMNGVGSWILGIDDLGNKKLMKPGRNYHFKGGKVVEYPIMYQFGGLLGNTKFTDYAGKARIQNMKAGLPFGQQPKYTAQNAIAPAIQSMQERHPENVQYLPQYAQDYLNVGKSEQKQPIANNRQNIVDFLWAMENQHGVGMNPDGTYSRYRDPNGRDYDVGPGLVIGSAIENKPFYTKQELDDAAYNYYSDSMNKLQPLYDDKYGVGQFDKLDDNSKMVIFDVMYRAGQNGVNPTTWPNLFDAAYNNDTQRLLKESRTRFKNNGRWNYDNARVKRVGEYLYPEIFDYRYKNSLDRNLNVIKRQYGGVLKPFSYFDIPIVRFDEGGYAYI